MNIKYLKNIGYCAGVKKALTNLDNIIINNPYKRIICFGSLIHNELVINDYMKKGVIFLELNKENIKLLNKYDIVVYSAHGHDEELAKLITNTSYDLICPILNNIHKFIKDNNDKKIIVIGNKNHDEVKSFKSISNNVYIYDLKEGLDNNINKEDEIIIISQSTLYKDQYLDIVDNLLNKYKNAKYYDKCCSVCKLRQEEIEDLGMVDNIVIVSSLNSSNGTRLYEIAKKHSKHAYIIRDIKELDKLNLEGGVYIGSATSANIYN